MPADVSIHNVARDLGEILRAIQADPRYLANLDWGEPREGHPEGTIGAHIAELERNLDRLRPRLTHDEQAKLSLLIHTHDTFKPHAQDAPILHPRSHASLARQFLGEFVDDLDLLNMVQFHDEPYALFRRTARGRPLDCQRFERLLRTIKDWDLFLAFLLIDGSTEGKSRQPLRWFFRQVEGKVHSRISVDDIL